MKQDEWAKHVAAWKRSGQTANEYGEAVGIVGKKLQWWKWFLKAKARTSKDAFANPDSRGKASVELVPVKLRMQQSAVNMGRQEPQFGARIEIALPNGSVVRAAPGVDPRWLGRLIVEAGARAC
jgi:hypothetical protein